MARYVVTGLAVCLALWTTSSAVAANHRELRIDGSQNLAEFGYSVSYGDVNGDGYTDMIVGSPSYGLSGASGTTDGRVFLYYGSPSGFQATPDWMVDSDLSSAYFGGDVAAGDIDNNGYADIIIGAPHANSNDGRVYVFLGSASGPVASGSENGIPLATGADADAIISAQSTAEQFGTRVAGLGDINGDNLGDIIVGADQYNGGDGRAYIFYGSAATVLSSSADWVFDIGMTGARFGSSVGPVGKVDGSGDIGVIIGAKEYTNGEAREGGAFIFLYDPSIPGFSSAPPNVGVSDADWSAESNQADAALGTEFGASVASAGNVNGDAYDDVIVGAWAYDQGGTVSGSGRAYVYYGSAGGLSTTPDWIAEGTQSYGSLGSRAVSAGDINHDGYDDIITGAEQYDNGQTDEGVGLVYYGSSTGLTPGTGTPPIVHETDADWMGESNEGSSKYGAWVTSLGDVDCDGTDDYAVSAYEFDISNPSSADGSAEGVVFTYLSGSAPQLVVNPTAGLNTTEAGGTATFTVALSTQPVGDVTVNVASAVPSEGTVSPQTLTFTGGTSTCVGGTVNPAGNWATPQTVTVTGVDDNVDDGNQGFNVNLSVDSANTQDDNYLSATDSVAVINADNDTAGVTVSSATIYTTDGGTATFTVVLDTKPTAGVTIGILSSDTTAGTVSPSSLAFNVNNWNVPQTVTVTGGANMSAVYQIDMDASSSAAGEYKPVSIPSVNATNTLSTVTVGVGDGTASEPGTDTGSYIVTRTANTSLALTVNYSVSGTATSGIDYTALSGSVTIPAGFDSASIKLTPLNDTVVEGDETVIVTVTPAAGYIVGTADNATITITDDDVLPTASFTLDQKVVEGSQVTVTVNFDTVPTVYPVQIPYTVSGTAQNPSDHNAADGTITIASGTSGSITFQTVDDKVVEGDETVIFTMGPLTNAVTGTKNSQTVTITDNDTGGGSGGGGGCLSPWFIALLIFGRVVAARPYLTSHRQSAS